MALDWLKDRLNLSTPPAVPSTHPGHPAAGAPASAPSRRRNQRIDAEVLMIANRFSRPPYHGVCYDEANRDWLVIPNYPLPSRFRARNCDLLIVFPETYPETPPIGFYLNQKFSLRDGRNDPHLTSAPYHGAPDLRDQGWHWYCVQMNMQAEGAWQPHADHRHPDNLWTFPNMVPEVLSNDF